MNTEKFDTPEGIRKYLQDGISGFHQLAKDRRRAGYGDEENGRPRVDLKRWILYGCWCLDGIGNTAIITEGQVIGAEEVLDYESFFIKYKGSSITTTHKGTIAIPGVGDVCPQCLKGWELRNLYDHVAVDFDMGRSHTSCEYAFFHPDCRSFHLTQQALKVFSEVYQEAGLESVSLRPVRNEYGSTKYHGPWTIAETPAGLIRMGWRRNVIHIDWSLCQLKSIPDFLSESVTKGPTHIHAWGLQIAVEYIRRILACS